MIAGNRYKIILGMDMLDPLAAVIDTKEKLLTLTDSTQGYSRRMRLLDKDEVKKQRAIKDYVNHLRSNPPVTCVNAVELPSIDIDTIDDAARLERCVAHVAEEGLEYLADCEALAAGDLLVH
jgi:hypothetical protein